MPRHSEPRANLYSRVTDRIVADLERGVRPWLKPWNAEHAAGRITRPLRHNGLPYSGVNVLLLWSEAVDRGYSAPLWMTFKQALALGACVRKGETGSTVVYADAIRKTETGDHGEDIERRIPFLKAYGVFNVEQIDGLPAHYHAPAATPLSPLERIDTAERFIASTGARVQHGGNRAFYSGAADSKPLEQLQRGHRPECRHLPPFPDYAFTASLNR